MLHQASLGLLILLLAAPPMGVAEQPAYKNPSKPVGARVRDLLKRMTVAEKIGQMTQIERSVATPEIMKQYSIGSVLSGGGSAPASKATGKQWVDMVNALQQGSLSSRLGTPMIYGIHAVHGHNNVVNATIFPHNVGLGATRDPELVKKIGAATAREVRGTGIQYVFAPCIAVCRDPRWGRCYESYSEDPKIVEMMTDIIPGLQGERPEKLSTGIPFVTGKDKVAACAKHFVGDGGTINGINGNNTIIDRTELLKIHMRPYYDAVIKGVSTVMISDSSWNGTKMHANRDLITGFLKNKLQFKGFVISDWQGINKITSPRRENYTFSVLTSVNAGLDMIMVPYDYLGFLSNMTYLIEKKFIPMRRVDDAVTRILRVKFSMGLFDNPLADLSFTHQIGSEEHWQLAREAVRKSLVLLKNGKPGDSPILPIPKKSSKILVAGSHANNLGYQCGGWTIQRQGFSGNNVTNGTRILSAINDAIDPSSSMVVYYENPNWNFALDGAFSAAIIVLGELPYAETEGDSQNLTLSEQGLRTVNEVCSGGDIGTDGVKCVVVLVTGRPVVVEPWLEEVDGLVAAWLPGTEGKGVVDVLFGDYGFTGKLPRTWFRKPEQLPLNVGDRNYDPLFPLGFGLTTKGMNSSP